MSELLKLPLNLREIQCPFTWQIYSYNFDNIEIERIYQKLSNPHCNDWKMFNLKLLLACTYGYKKQVAKAFQVLEECENHALFKCNELFFHDIKEGMQHMIDSSKCYLNFKMGRNKKAYAISSNMNCFKCLSTFSQAAIWATKAYILCECGTTAMEQALLCVKIAIQLDPDENGRRRGAWYYLAGKIIAKLRKIVHGYKIPEPEEQKYLERSVKNDTFVVHLAFLAKEYRDTATSYMRKRSPSNTEKSEMFFMKSLKTYECIMKNKGTSIDILIRCALDLKEVPRWQIDRFFDRKAFDAAIMTARENLNKIMAFNSFKDWNERTGTEHNEKTYLCAFEEAAGSFIKLKSKIRGDYIPLEDCDFFISCLEGEVPTDLVLQKKVYFMVVKGEYYFHRVRNLVAAAQEWDKAFNTAPSSRYLLDYKCIFNYKEMTVNIYKMLTKKIKYYLRMDIVKDKARKRYLIGLWKKYQGLA